LALMWVDSWNSVGPFSSVRAPGRGKPRGKPWPGLSAAPQPQAPQPVSAAPQGARNASRRRPGQWAVAPPFSSVRAQSGTKTEIECGGRCCLVSVQCHSKY